MEEPLRVLLIQRRAVNHDHATGGYALCAGVGLVAGIGVGNVQGQLVFLAGLAPVDPIDAFRRAQITLALFGAFGLLAEGHPVGLECFAAAHQVQAAL
ncbi:hypothetical protein D3C87_1897430 [compost metagenome]